MMEKVTDLDYFQGVEAAITKAMKQFEVSMLGTAQQAATDTDAKIDRDIPVEGYYNEEGEDLKEYFLTVRALQNPDNFSETVTEAVRTMHSLYTDPVFGLQQALPTALNRSSVARPNDDPVIISPVRDPVSAAVYAMQPLRPTMQNIMEHVNPNNLGIGLVGFAYLVDAEGKVGGVYNPVATAWGCETTVLSREKFVLESCAIPMEKEWAVAQHVQEAGEQCIDAYNALFDQFGRSDLLVAKPTTPDAIDALIEYAARDPDRLVNLGRDEAGNEYHWAVVPTAQGFKAVDFWTPGVILTTAEYQKDNSMIAQYLDENTHPAVLTRFGLPVIQRCDPMMGDWCGTGRDE